MHVHHMCSRHHQANIFVFNSLDRKEGEGRERSANGAPSSLLLPLFLAVLCMYSFLWRLFFYSAAPSPPIGWEGEKFYSKRRHLHLAFSSSVWLLSEGTETYAVL